MKRSSLFLVLLFVVVIGGSLFLKSRISPSEKNRIQNRIDDIFERWNSPSSPGAALAVVKGKRTTYAHGYGSANLEYDIPITPKTVFHVASVSKQFTAFAVLLLADQKKLTLDDDIHHYLPEIPDFGKTISIRHLLHHTSGLRDQWELLALAGWRLDDVITKNHIFKMLSRQRELNFAPGDEYLYCNTGYTLLAEIVARVTEQPFPDWMKANIFDPLGMADTRIHDNHEEIVKNRAYSYAPQDGEFRKRVLSYANAGATSLFTTAEDLVLWVNNFNHPVVGSNWVLSQMVDQGKLNSGEVLPYACGLIFGEHGGLQTIGHSGSDAGFRSYIVRFPEEDLAVIVLSNLSSINASRLALQVADLYLAKKIRRAAPPKKKAQRKAVELDPRILAAYEGQYQIRPDYILTLQKQDNRLTVQATGGNRSDLYAAGEGRFFRRDADFEITFSVNNIGDVTGITVLDRGQEIKGKKIDPFVLDQERLSEYAGEYYSFELDTFYRLAVADDHLVVRNRKYDDFPLSLITPDYFLGTEWFFRKVQFTRDSSGGIDGFLVTGNRVRNLRFTKQLTPLLRR